MNSDKLKNQLTDILKQLIGLRLPLFILIVVLIYGFLVLRINTLKNAEPSQSAIAEQTQAEPHIDPTTVNKIKQLQDDSVSVQALFNQARQDPFQE